MLNIELQNVLKCCVLKSRPSVPKKRSSLSGRKSCRSLSMLRWKTALGGLWESVGWVFSVWGLKSTKSEWFSLGVFTFLVLSWSTNLWLGCSWMWVGVPPSSYYSLNNFVYALQKSQTRPFSLKPTTLSALQTLSPPSQQAMLARQLLDAPATWVPPPALEPRCPGAALWRVWTFLHPRRLLLVPWLWT